MSDTVSVFTLHIKLFACLAVRFIPLMKMYVVATLLFIGPITHPTTLLDINDNIGPLYVMASALAARQIMAVMSLAHFVY